MNFIRAVFVVWVLWPIWMVVAISLLLLWFFGAFS